MRERLATFAAANWSSPWREALRLSAAVEHVTVSERATAAYLAQAALRPAR